MALRALSRSIISKPCFRQVPALTQKRLLNVHEYVGIEVMNKFGIPTPVAKVASSPQEVENIVKNDLPNGDVVVKAQVLAGGRGKGHFLNGFQGGVHICTSVKEASDIASKMLGQSLVTKQTGAEGRPCNKVLVSERMYLRKELYLSLLMDRAYNGPVLVGSPAGGTSIEDVAEATPELIFTEPIDINVGLTDEAANRMATNLGLEDGSKAHGEAVKLMVNLYKMFIATDATLVEINPLAETPDGRVLACDAKLNFDDNAEFRQKEMFAYRDFSQEDPREVEADRFDLNYVGLDGNIGCMVNGAGLAMSTMDLIKLKGGEPANFLDVGGGATEEQVQKAFELLNGDAKVEAILVNIFGGIMRCDVIAQGVLNAAAQIGMEKPIVIRLQGTNVEKASKLLQDSDFKMVVCNDLDAAADKAVGIAKIVKAAREVDVKVKIES